MSKLYVFGIGGTGSRVLRALSMLLASGVECKADTIVPIIIDPDHSAADLTRTVKTMEKYNDVRLKLDFDNNNPNRFFKTEISETVQGFRLPLNNIQGVKFKEYMDINTMNESNKAFVSMLFSSKNLEADMKVGFKGNPNIGSLVLNQFADSQEFKDFSNNFQQGDRIFIVSSIFGGTGASGFPLLLKTLRGNDKIPNFALINKAQIGGITVLPYFGVKQNDESEVDSSTFISKTKSALSYYDRNISGTNSVNTLYYIADTIQNAYENCEGGTGQKNNAHFIELLSALAILDFAASNDNVGTTTHKEFGLEKDSSDIIFSDFGRVSQKQLQKPLTQFLLFCKYINVECYKEYKHQPWAIDKKMNKAFFDRQFVKDIKSIQVDFIEWLTEMNNNKRRFSLYELENKCNLFDVVKGREANKLKCLSSNYALFDNKLNKQSVSGTNIEQQFVELFYRATEELVDQKFNF